MQSLRSSKKSSTKKWLVSLTVVLFLAAATTAGLYALKLGPFATANQTSSNDDQTDKNGSDGSPVGEPGASDPSSNSAKNPDKTDDPAQSTNKDIQITAAYVNNDVLQVRTLIPKVTAEGNCTIQVASSGQVVYSSSAGVQALSSSSTCKGFDVPLSSLGPGTWTITVTYTAAASTSTATKEVIIDA